MGRVFLGPLFKSWSDIYDYSSRHDPSHSLGGCRISLIFPKRDIQGYKEPSKYTMKFLQVLYNYEYHIKVIMKEPPRKPHVLSFANPFIENCQSFGCLK
jgi:hypothetical protein